MTAHAALGASGAHRWMNCPGSIRLGQEAPESDTGSFYALEGTAAHELGERCLQKGLSPHDFVGIELHGVEVTEEMAEAVQVYVDFVDSLYDRRTDPDALMIERRFNLRPLNPPGPMFGTADAVVWRGRTLHVVDYKHGAGVAVDAVGNPQLRYYGLGALLAVNKVPEEIRLTIVQPRAHHRDGPVRTDVLTFSELVEFKHELFAAAEATTDPNAPLVVGDWCRFCPALAICPAQQQHAIEVAQTEFGVFQPPAPETLAPQDIATVLAAADALSGWLSAVQSHALTILEQGGEVPGWKLVEGRLGNRKWVDEEEVVDALLEAGMEEADLYRKQLLSPAQAEKAAKKAGAEVDFDSLTHRAPGKPRLAPADDPRPALALSASDDFDIPSE